MSRSPILLALLLVASGSAVAGEPADHPLLSRFPGAEIQRQVVTDFDEYHWQTGVPELAEAAGAPPAETLIAGRIHRTGYELPETASPLAAFRSYRQALDKAGFTVAFQCEGIACGEGKLAERNLMTMGSVDRQYYLAASKGSAPARTLVAIHLSQNGDGGFIHADVDVAEERPLPPDLIKVNRNLPPLPPMAQESSGPNERDRGIDPPLLSRYPGAVIDKQVVKEFDQYQLASGAQGEEPPTTTTLEGHVSRTGYVLPATASLASVFRSYSQALDQAGFKLIFGCSNSGCGSDDFWSDHDLMTTGSRDMQRYLAMNLERPDGTITVAFHLSQNGDGGFIHGQLDIVTERPLAKDLIKVGPTSLAGLTDDFSRDGRAIVRDLLFATDSAELLPESEPVLVAIASYLQQNAERRLWVVGHTDSQGSLDHNLPLAEARAKAVIAALTSRHQIAAARLQPFGVGPLAPVASNSDEAGRALNRRVELILAP